MLPQHLGHETHRRWPGLPFGSFSFTGGPDQYPTAPKWVAALEKKSPPPPPPPTLDVPLSPLSSPWAVNTVTTFEDTAFALESSTFDLCGGHATAKGIYHYHSTPGCLQEQATKEAGRNASQHSPLLGWSYVSDSPHSPWTPNPKPQPPITSTYPSRAKKDSPLQPVFAQKLLLYLLSVW